MLYFIKEPSWILLDTHYNKTTQYSTFCKSMTITLVTLWLADKQKNGKDVQPEPLKKSLEAKQNKDRLTSKRLPLRSFLNANSITPLKYYLRVSIAILFFTVLIYFFCFVITFYDFFVKYTLIWKILDFLGIPKWVSNLGDSHFRSLPFYLTKDLGKYVLKFYLTIFCYFIKKNND